MSRQVPFLVGRVFVTRARRAGRSDVRGCLHSDVEMAGVGHVLGHDVALVAVDRRREPRIAMQQCAGVCGIGSLPEPWQPVLSSPPLMSMWSFMCSVSP